MDQLNLNFYFLEPNFPCTYSKCSLKQRNVNLVCSEKLERVSNRQLNPDIKTLGHVVSSTLYKYL